MNKILIVEPDFKLAEKLSRSFTDGDTHALSCADMRAAEHLLEQECYNMIIIDTQLPDGDGYDLIYEIGLNIYKTKEPIIIIMLPNDKKPDTMELIEQGISDYITKPFSTAVLKAKVFTQFTRQKKDFTLDARKRFEATGSCTAKSIIGEHRVVMDNYIFDFDNEEYMADGKSVNLSLLEQSILRTLVENKGIVLKRKALIDKLKSESKTCIDEKILADTVNVLTDKLSAHHYMKTVFGIGYMWTTIEDGALQ